jgi:hypothetical protein
VLIQPSQPKTLNDKTHSILFTVKHANPTSPSGTSPTTSSSSLLATVSSSPHLSTQTPVNNPNNNNNSNSSAYESINIDQFVTKSTKKGKVLWADVSKMRLNTNSNPNLNCLQTNPTTTPTVSTNATTSTTTNCSNAATNSSSLPSTPMGLLMDIANIQKVVNIFDYVHSNDVNHLTKHFADVCQKGENTSAIYRMKITEKYAFVQTSSKLQASAQMDNNNLNDQTNSDIVVDDEHDKEEENKEQTTTKNSIIFSTHSIIKEIDSDVEMKGSASTSLMKTLINKKPCISPSSSSSASLLTQMPTSSSNSKALSIMSSPNTSFDSSTTYVNNANSNKKSRLTINIPPQSTESNCIKTHTPTSNAATSPVPSTTMLVSPSTLTPSQQQSIGTKFTMTMLGLKTPTLQQQPNQRSISIDSISDSLQRQTSSSSLAAESNDFDMSSDMDSIFAHPDGQQQTKSGLKSIDEPNDSNAMLKKLLIRNNNSLNESNTDVQFDLLDSNSIKQEKLAYSLDDVLQMDVDSTGSSSIHQYHHHNHNHHHQNKQYNKHIETKSKEALSTTNDSLIKRTNSVSDSNHSRRKSAKDDIILRALLNTSDLEPQVLQLESVFELSQNSNNNNNNAASKPLSSNNSTNSLIKHDMQNKTSAVAKNTSSSLQDSKAPTLAATTTTSTATHVTGAKRGPKPSQNKNAETKQSRAGRAKTNKSLVEKDLNEKSLLNHHKLDPRFVSNNKHIQQMQQENMMLIKEENLFHMGNNEYQDYAFNGELNSNNLAMNNNSSNNKSVLKQMLANDGLKRAGQISNQSQMFTNYTNATNSSVLYNGATMKEKQFGSSSSTCTSVSSSSSSSLSPINKLNTLDYTIAQPQQQHHQTMPNMLEHNLLQQQQQSFHSQSYLQAHSIDPILSVSNKYANDLSMSINEDDVDVINQLEQVINLSNNSEPNLNNSYDQNQQTVPQTVKMLNQSIYPNDSFGQTYPPNYNTSYNLNDGQTMNMNIPFNIQQQQQQQQLKSNRLVETSNHQSTNMVVNTGKTSLPTLAKNRSADTIKDDDLTKQKRIEAITKHLKSDLIESFKLSKGNTNNNLIEDQFHSNQSSSIQQQYRSQANKADANFVPNVTIDTSHNLPRLIGMTPMSINRQISPSTPNRMRTSSNSTGLGNDEYMGNEMVDMSVTQGAGFMNVSVNSNGFFNSTNSGSHQAVDLRKKLQERLQRNAANINTNGPISNSMGVVQSQQMSPQINYAMNSAAFNVKNEQITSPSNQPIMSPYQTTANAVSRVNNNSTEFMYQAQSTSQPKLPSASSIYKQPQNSPISQMTTTVTVTTQNYSANQAMPKTYSPVGNVSNSVNPQQYQFQNNNNQKVLTNYGPNASQVNNYASSASNSMSHSLFDNQANSPNYYLPKSTLDLEEHQLVANRPTSSSSSYLPIANSNKLVSNTDSMSKAYNSVSPYNPNSSSMPHSLASTPTKTNLMVSMYNNSPSAQQSPQVLNNMVNNIMPSTNDNADLMNSTAYNQQQQQQQQQQQFYQQQSNIQNNNSNMKYTRATMSSSNRSMYSSLIDTNNKLAAPINEQQFLFDDDLDVNNLLSTPTNDHTDHLSFDTGSLATSTTATMTSAASATTTTTTTTSSASATLTTSTANGSLIDTHHHSYQHQPAQPAQQYSSTYPPPNSNYHPTNNNAYFFQSSFQSNNNTSQTMDLYEQDQHTNTNNTSIQQQSYQPAQPIYQQQLPINNNPSIINNYNTNININNPNAGVGLMIQDDPRGGLLHQLLLD